MEGLRMLLEAEPDLAVAGDQARQLDPDVILMDVRMPRMNGIEATTRLVQTAVRARILMLTTYDLDEYVHPALQVGRALRIELAEGLRTPDKCGVSDLRGMAVCQFSLTLREGQQPERKKTVWP